MSEREPGTPHEISLAIWDLASPVVAGRRATLKVGVACSAGCDLTGASVNVFDETGSGVGEGSLGSTPWPGTAALYWTELDLPAPEDEGNREWTVQASQPSVVCGRTSPVHVPVRSTVRFVVSGPPAHRITLAVVEKGSGLPLAGVGLRLGRFRAVTNDAGIACVDVPRGTYEIVAWKIGYAILSQTAEVASDTTVHLHVRAEPEPEQPYWM